MTKLSFNLTQGVNSKVADDESFAKFVMDSVKRHFNNDFSECNDEDAELNRLALIDGGRIFNVFKYNETEKIWIITEAEPHRGITTVLFPSEY